MLNAPVCLPQPEITENYGLLRLEMQVVRAGVRLERNSVVEKINLCTERSVFVEFGGMSRVSDTSLVGVSSFGLNKLLLVREQKFFTPEILDHGTDTLLHFIVLELDSHFYLNQQTYLHPVVILRLPILDMFSVWQVVISLFEKRK